MGKDIVFSLLIGLPLTVFGWPGMLNADFIHQETLGIKPALPITAISSGVIFVYFIWRASKKHDEKVNTSTQN